MLKTGPDFKLYPPRTTLRHSLSESHPPQWGAPSPSLPPPLSYLVEIAIKTALLTHKMLNTPEPFMTLTVSCVGSIVQSIK